MLRRLSATVVLALVACTSGGETPEGGTEIPDGGAPTVEVGAATGDTTATTQAGEASPDASSEGEPVVVFLGTSLTAGLGLFREEDTYVARLEALGDSAGLPFRAVNAGVSGETSAGGLRRVDWVLREPLDVLVVELGANDGLRGQAPGAMAENLTAVIETARDRYPDAVIILAGMEAPPNLGAEYTDAFRAVFRTVAREQDAVLIPFLLEGVAGVDSLNQSDGIHPNPLGHRIIAGTVWPYLESVLPSPPSGGTP